MRTIGNTLSIYLACTLFVATCGKAQSGLPAKWYFSAIPLNEWKMTLTFTVVMDEGWYIYSQSIKKEDLVLTQFTFEPSNNYTLAGEAKEENVPAKTSGIFRTTTFMLAPTAVFTQSVTLNATSATIRGKVEFMICSNFKYLLPAAWEFDVLISQGNGMQHTILPLSKSH